MGELLAVWQELETTKFAERLEDRSSIRPGKVTDAYNILWHLVNGRSDWNAGGPNCANLPVEMRRGFVEGKDAMLRPQIAGAVCVRVYPKLNLPVTIDVQKICTRRSKSNAKIKWAKWLAMMATDYCACCTVFGQIRGGRQNDVFCSWSKRGTNDCLGFWSIFIGS